MNSDVRGSYRLFRQGDGRAAFGEVHVVVAAADRHERDRSQWAVDPATSSVHLETNPVVATAAIEGARDGLLLAESLGASVQDCTALVTKVVINLADADTTAVHAAASAAVIHALGLESECRLVYENGWRYEARPPDERAIADR